MSHNLRMVFLKKINVLSTGAHGATVEYTVEVDGSPILFMSNEYYFRVFSPSK